MEEPDVDDYIGKLAKQYFSEYAEPPVQEPLRDILFMNTKIVDMYQNKLGILGQTKEGNSVFVHVNGFYTWFYIEIVDGHDDVTIEEIYQAYGKSRIAKIEKVMGRSYFGYHPNEKMFYKLTLVNSSQLKAVRLTKVNFVKQTYEGKTKYPTRFMIEKQITAFSWIHLPYEKYERLEGRDRYTYCQIEVSMYWEDIVSIPVEQNSSFAPMRSISWDTEMTNPDCYMPEPYKETDQVISIACYASTLPAYTYDHSIIFCIGETKPIEGVHIVACPDQKTMMMMWAAYVRAGAFVFLGGYNSINWDMWWMIEKSRNIRIHSTFSRLDWIDRKCKIRASEFESNASRFSLKCAYIRHEMDMNIAASRDVMLRIPSYKLDAVAKEVLGERKDDMPYTALNALQWGTFLEKIPVTEFTIQFLVIWRLMTKRVVGGHVYFESNELSKKYNIQNEDDPDFATLKKQLGSLPYLSEEYIQFLSTGGFLTDIPEHVEWTTANKLMKLSVKNRVPFLEPTPESHEYRKKTRLEASSAAFYEFGGYQFAVPETFLGVLCRILLVFNTPVEKDGTIWWEATPRGRRMINVYCLKDAKLAAMIDKKKQYTLGCVMISRLTTVDCVKVLTGGQTTRITTYVLQFLRGKNLFFKDVDSIDKKNQTDESYTGARVFDPLIGIHDDPTATLDFEGLYPAIMAANNMDLSTVLQQHEVEAFERTTGVSAIRIPDENETYYFVPSSVHEGYIPEMLVKLKAARAVYKKKMGFAQDMAEEALYAKKYLEGKYEPEKHKLVFSRRGENIWENEWLSLSTEEMWKKANSEYDYWNGEASAGNSGQAAVKVIMNSMYGVTGNRNGEMPCVQISAAVTAYGRIMITKVANMCQSQHPETGLWGYDPKSTNPLFMNGVSPYPCFIIYGDTDSVFVKMIGCPDIPTAWPIAQKLAKMASEMLIEENKGAKYALQINLVLEKIYRRLWMKMKKKYIGLQYDSFTKNSVKAKGIEVIRRDQPRFLQELCHAVIKLLIPVEEVGKEVKSDVEGAIRLVHETIAKMKSGFYTYQNYAVSSSVNDKEYVNQPPPPVILAQRILERDKVKIEPGTRIFFIFVIAPKGANGKRSLSNQIETPEYAELFKKPIDVDLYIEKYMKNSLAGLFSLCFIPQVRVTTLEEFQNAMKNQFSLETAKQMAMQKLFVGPHMNRYTSHISDQSKFSPWKMQSRYLKEIIDKKTFCLLNKFEDQRVKQWLNGKYDKDIEFAVQTRLDTARTNWIQRGEVSLLTDELKKRKREEEEEEKE
jgi:DNA polymerase elongation subunit (family B)